MKKTGTILDNMRAAMRSPQPSTILDNINLKERVEKWKQERRAPTLEMKNVEKRNQSSAVDDLAAMFESNNDENSN